MRAVSTKLSFVTLASSLALAGACSSSNKKVQSTENGFNFFKKDNSKTIELQKAAGLEVVDEAAPAVPTLADIEAARKDLKIFVTSHRLMGQYYQDDTRQRACFLNPLGEKYSDAAMSTYCEMPFEFRFCNSLAIKKVEENPELEGKPLEKLQRKMKRYDQCRGAMGALYDSLFNGFNFDGFKRDGHKASGKVKSVYYWTFLRGADYVKIAKKQDASFDEKSLVKLPTEDFDRTDRNQFAELAVKTNTLYAQVLLAPIHDIAKRSPTLKVLQLDDDLEMFVTDLEDQIAVEIGKFGSQHVVPKLSK
jgi:hypothetical protein